MRPPLPVLLGALALAGSGAGATPPAPLRLVFASNRDGVDRLYSTREGGGPVTRLVARNLAGAPAVVAARAGTVVFTDRDAGLYAVGAGGGGLRRLGQGFWPAVTADGRRVAYGAVVQGRTGIWTVGADGRGSRRLTRAGDALPAWAPDGRRLAFFRSGRRNALAVVGPSGRARVIARGHISFVAPAWSADGRSIAFVRVAEPGGASLWVVRPDGRGARRVASGVDSFAWAPDGRRLAAAGAAGLVVVGRRGGVRHLRAPGLATTRPAWSPDGRRIAFEGSLGGGDPTQIWTIGADGSGLRRVTGRGVNRLVGWTTAVPRVPPAAPLPPSETASHTLVRTRAPITDLSADGSRVAFVAGRTRLDCDHVGVWQPGGPLIRFGLPAPCRLLSTGTGVYDVELAGSRAAWVEYAGGNHWDFVLRTATLGAGRPALDLTFDSLEVGLRWDYHLHGDAGLLVFDDGPRLVRIGAGSEACSAKVVLTRRICTLLANSADSAPVAAVGAGRIAVAEPAGIALLDARGRLLRVVPVAGLDAAAVRVDGAHLVVVRADAIESYSVADGRLEAARALGSGERLLDADGGLALVLAGRELRVVRLADGRSTTITAPGARVVAELEPPGLFYAYTAGAGGRLAFVPIASVLAGLR